MSGTQTFCLDCWANYHIETPAITEYEGDDLCKPCALARGATEAELIIKKPQPVAPPPVKRKVTITGPPSKKATATVSTPQPARGRRKMNSWGPVIRTVLLLKIGGTYTMHAEGDQASYANLLRVMLCQNKETRIFKWSVKKVNTEHVSVTKLHRADGAPVIETQEAPMPKRSEPVKTDSPSETRPVTEPVAVHSNGQGQGSVMNFKSGGKLSIMFDGNVFALSDEDRGFLFEIMDKVKKYDTGART